VEDPVAVINGNWSPVACTEPASEDPDDNGSAAAPRLVMDKVPDMVQSPVTYTKSPLHGWSVVSVTPAAILSDVYWTTVISASYNPLGFVTGILVFDVTLSDPFVPNPKKL